VEKKNEKAWNYLIRDSRLPVSEYLKNALEFDQEDRSARVLDMAVGYRSAVSAVELLDKERGERVVRAVVMEFRRVPREEREALLAKGVDATFAWRAFDESEGPSITKAPRRILERLSPADSDLARRWREACWRRVRELENKGYRPLVIGDIIKLEKPVMFQDGRERSVFLVTHDGMSRIGVGGVCLEDGADVSLNRVVSHARGGLERMTLPERLPPNAEGPVMLREFPQGNGEVSFVAISAVGQPGEHPAGRVLARSFYREEIERDVNRVNEDYKYKWRSFSPGPGEDGMGP